MPCNLLQHLTLAQRLIDLDIESGGGCIARDQPAPCRGCFKHAVRSEAQPAPFAGKIQVCISNSKLEPKQCW